MFDQSEISVSAHGSICFSGRDAVEFYRAIALRSAIDLYARSKIKMTRQLTPSTMLQLAGQFTGKSYKRGQYAQASADLAVWIETMRAALPVTNH
jgi:hypothetical protein